MSMRGSTIGTLAGAVIGGVIGYFTPLGPFLGASIGATIGGTIGGVVDYVTAGDQINRQESMAGLQIQSSAYGQPMAQVFDTHRLAGNIIFISPKKAHEHRTTEGGGKGGPKRVSITKTYSVDLGIALCDTLMTGPMTRIDKVWADGTLLWINDPGGGRPYPTGWTFYPGTDTQPIDPTMNFWFGNGVTPRYIYTCYVVMDDYDLGPYPRVPNFTFEVTQGERTLPQVVTTLAQAAGVDAAAIDVADLETPRVRYLVTGVQAVRTMLEQLMVAYRFYLRETGLGLEARRLGAGDVVASVPEADLDASERPGQTQGLQIVRERSRLLPTQLNVTYTAVRRDYQPGTQLATIGTLNAVESPRAISTAVALEDADAKALAQENLDRLWIERTQYALELSRKWGYLEAGDRITVTSREQTHSLLLTEAQYGRPGLLQLKARGDSVPVLFVAGAPPAVGNFPETVLLFLQPTTVLFLDLPAMDTNDQAPRFHVIYAYPETSPEDHWPGATLHRSQDGGASYTVVHAGTLEAIAGTALTALPSAPAHFTDTTSTLEVHLEHGQIFSLTDEAFQGGGNVAWLGQELIQFRDAELTAPGTYTLSHFWRGRRGTEWAVGTHTAGEPFVWIDQAVYSVEMPLGERYVTRQWKTVTSGLDIASAVAEDYAAPSRNLLPWDVTNYVQTRQVGDDWLLEWRGRARFTGAWVDGSEATPDPDFLTYRVVIYADATLATIARQVDVPDNGAYQSVQTYTYSAADQTTDFGSVQTILYATVFQVGRYGVSRAALV